MSLPQTRTDSDRRAVAWLQGLQTRKRSKVAAKSFFGIIRRPSDQVQAFTGRLPSRPL